MSKLWLSISTLTLANIIAFFQLNGQFLNIDWFKKPTSIILLGLPLSLMFWKATLWSYEHFGFFWNIRLMGFGLGTLIFGIMTWTVLGEQPTLKVIISLLLALAIILLQITNVVK